jgi:hypothetical protein
MVEDITNKNKSREELMTSILLEICKSSVYMKRTAVTTAYLLNIFPTVASCQLNSPTITTKFRLVTMFIFLKYKISIIRFLSMFTIYLCSSNNSLIIA